MKVTASEISADHLCVLELSGAIIAVNQAWRDLAAKSPSLPVSGDVGVNYFAVWEAAIEAGATSARESLQGLRAVGRGALPQFAQENSWPTAEGKRWFEMRSQRLHTAGSATVVVSYRDITARKRHEQALGEREELHRRLVAAESDAIFLVDCETGRFMEANPSAERMYGYSRNEFLALKVTDISAEPAKSMDAIQSGETFVALRRHRRRDGTVFPVEIAGGYLEWSGRRMHVAAIRDITERERAEAMLQESERRLQMALAAAECGSFDYDFLTGSLRWNERQKRIWGLAPGETPTFGGTLARVHPEDQERVKQLATAVTAPASNGIYEAEYRIVWPDGSIHWNSVKGRVFFEGEGKDRKPVRWLGVERDLTAQKQMEAALRESETKFKTLYQLAPVGISLLDRDHRIIDANPALEKIVRLTRQELLAGSYRKRQYLRADGSPKPREEFASVRALAEKQPIHDIETGIVTEDGDTIWTQASAAPLELSEANVVVITRDITVRKRAEAALRESEQRFASVFRKSPLAIGISRLSDGVFLEVNEAFVQLYGYARDEIVGHTAVELDLWHSGNRDAVIRKLREQKGWQVVEMQARRKDGAIRDLLASAESIVLGGELCMVGFLSDITESKRMEETLRESEARYRAVVEDQTEVICRFRADGTILFVNEVYCRFFGKTGVELVGHKWQPHAVAADTPAIEAKLETLVAANPVVVIENRVYAGSGEVRWMQFVNRGFFDPQGRLLEIQAVGRDITERKEAEAALRESEVVRHQALANAPDAVFAIDREYRLLFSNELYQKVLATSSGRPFAVGENVLSPDYPPEVLALWRAAYDRSLRGDQFKSETEWTNREGRRQVFENSFSPLRDAKDIIIGVLVVARDITVRKQAEETLRASHEQLRTLAGRLQSVREEERTVVAREIHDVLAQELTRLKMDIAWLQRRMSRPLLPEQQNLILEKLAAMTKVSDVAIESVQRIATGLRPVVLDTLGLPAAVEWAGHEFQSRTGVACRTTVLDEGVHVDPERVTAAFRILQESLTNIARHAGATQVEIQLGFEALGEGEAARAGSRMLTMQIRDNGRGISPAQLSNPYSLGLLGMRERAELLGGRCEIARHSAGGTIVSLRIPLSPAP